MFVLVCRTHLLYHGAAGRFKDANASLASPAAQYFRFLFLFMSSFICIYLFIYFRRSSHLYFFFFFLCLLHKAALRVHVLAHHIPGISFPGSPRICLYGLCISPFLFVLSILPHGIFRALFPWHTVLCAARAHTPHGNHIIALSLFTLSLSCYIFLYFHLFHPLFSFLTRPERRSAVPTTPEPLPKPPQFTCALRHRRQQPDMHFFHNRQQATSHAQLFSPSSGAWAAIKIDSHRSSP